jgi:hypothetical protein
MRNDEMKKRIPAEMASRVTLTVHDFFTPQPVVADVYFLRHILHAFNDELATQVLRALIPSLRKGARIIVNDFVLPVPGTLSRMEEKHMRTIDVLMQTVCNSREREEEEWKNLFALADSRFKWERAWQSSGRLWFIEVICEG